MTPSDASHDPGREADRTRRDASEEARRAGEEIRSAAQTVREHARDAVRDTGRLAREEANARVDRAADSAAAEAERAAAAAGDAASEYPDGALPSRALEGVSAFLEDTAHSLREADLESVAHDMTRFARRNPLTFLAGAAAVGFAAARIARAAPGGRNRFDDDLDEDFGGYAAADGPRAGVSSRAEDAVSGASDAPGPVQAQGIGSAAGLRTEEATGR